MKKHLILAVLVAAASLGGCADARLNKQLDGKLEKETEVKSRRDLFKEEGQLIRTTPGLSDDQRNKLGALWSETRAKGEALRKESLRLRAVLVQDLTEPGSGSDVTDVLKNRIQDVEHRRIQLLFQAVRSVNGILGRWESRQERENEGIYDDLIWDLTSVPPA